MADLVKRGCLLWSDKDVENLSVSQLIRRINISRAAFYKYFSNKDDFFAFLVLVIDEKVYEKIKQVNYGIGDPPAIICNSLIAYVKFGRDYPREATVLLKWSSAGLPPPGPRSIDVRSAIEAGLAERRFDGLGLETACLAVIGTANALLARAVDPEAQAHLEATVADSSATLLRFLGVPREEARQIVSTAARLWS